MALAMATAWLHPRSGVYDLRRRVPNELKALVGNGEIRRSLGTRDPKEAKRLIPAALAALEAQWATLLDGPGALNERACIEMAFRIGEGFLAHHQEAPSQQTRWFVEIGEELFEQSATALDLTRSAVELITEGFDRHAVKRAEMRAWCEDTADRYLAPNGLRVDADSRSDFVRAIADATQAAALSLRELSHGARRAFGVDPVEGRPVLDADDVGRHPQGVLLSAPRLAQDGEDVREGLPSLHLEGLAGGVRAVRS